MINTPVVPHAMHEAPASDAVPTVPRPPGVPSIIEPVHPLPMGNEMPAFVGHAEPIPPTAPTPILVPAPPAKAPRKRSNSGALIAIGLASLLLVGGVIAFLRLRVPDRRAAQASTAEETASTPSTSSRTSDTAVPAPEPVASAPTDPATTASATAVVVATEEPTPPPPSTAAPEPSASAPVAPSSSASVVSFLDPPSQPAEGLLSFQGALTVTSSSAAEVFVQGVSAGKTNERLVVRCGDRNVRLRGSDGEWKTPGVPVRIACMRATTIPLEPSS